MLNNRIACECPRRCLPPDPPTTIPYEPIEENVPKLKEWILDYYKGSSFNKCPHQALPLVKSSPPMQLHLQEDAIPVAIHKSSPVPVNWEDQVKDALQKEVDLGVLEKVPVGEPTSWCSRMVTTAKKNVKPRRVVDLRCLNKFALRQTHPTEAPFMQASRVPPTHTEPVWMLGTATTVYHWLRKIITKLPFSRLGAVTGIVFYHRGTWHQGMPTLTGMIMLSGIIHIPTLGVLMT